MQALFTLTSSESKRLLGKALRHCPKFGTQRSTGISSFHGFDERLHHRRAHEQHNE